MSKLIKEIKNIKEDKDFNLSSGDLQLMKKQILMESGEEKSNKLFGFLLPIKVAFMRHKIAFGISGLVFLAVLIGGMSALIFNGPETFKQEGKFAIESTFPNLNSPPHPVNEPLEIIFAREEMNLELLQRNIDLEPDAEFTVEVDLENPRKVLVNPIEAFEPNIQYKVTILAGDYGPGLTLDEDYVYYFLTQSDHSNEVQWSTMFWSDSAFNEKHTYNLFMYDSLNDRIGISERPENVDIKLYKTQNSEAYRALEEFSDLASRSDYGNIEYANYDFDINYDLAEEIHTTNVDVIPADYNWSIKTDLPIEESGIYYLEVQAFGKVIKRNFVLINSYGFQSRTLQKDHFVTAQSLRDSKVLPGVKIDGYIFRENAGLEKTGEFITDANGQASFTDDISYNLDVLVSEYNGELAIDNVSFYDLGIFSVDRLDQEYIFSEHYWWARGGLNASDYKYYVVTDRDLYKPGETIYYKVIGRYNENDKWQIRQKNIDVKGIYYDGESKEINIGNHQLDVYGTTHGEYTIPNDFDRNYVSLNVYDPDLEYAITGKAINIVDFEKPQYEITVELDKDVYYNGDELTAKITAIQYDGTVVRNQKIKVSTSTNPIWYYGAQEYGVCEEIARSYGYTRDRSRRLNFSDFREIQLDNNGYAEVTFKVDDTVVNQVGEVGVTAILGDQYGSRAVGSAERLFHPTQYYLSTYMDSSYVEVGQDSFLNLEVYDTNCEPVSNLTGSYSVNKVNFGSYYQENLQEILKEEFTTDNFGKNETQLNLEDNGLYKIITDTHSYNDVVIDETYIWIFSQNDSSQLYYKDYNTIAVDFDKDEYSVGDTAVATVYHPGFSGDLWMTINRNFVQENRIIPLDSYKSEISFEIKEEYVPTATLEISLFSNNKYFHSEKEIHVSIESKELNVLITPDKETYSPGEVATFRIRTTNMGNPAPSNIAVAIVDKAVLDLQRDRYYWQDESLLGSFYNENHIGMRDSFSLQLVNYDYFQGGMGAGGGEPRFDLANTAYWNPEIITNSNGEATFTVELPDNLTKWGIAAWAVTSDTKVGEGTEYIQTATDLKVQTFIPEQIVEGDTMEIYAKVFNSTDQAQNINLNINLSDDFELVDSNSSVPMNIDVNGNSETSWKVRALNGGETGKITIETEGGSDYDGIQKDVNILQKTYYNFQNYNSIGDGAFTFNNSNVGDQELIVKVVDSIPNLLTEFSIAPTSRIENSDPVSLALAHHIYSDNREYINGGSTTINQYEDNIEERLDNFVKNLRRTSDGGFYPRTYNSSYNADPDGTLQGYAALSHGVSLGYDKYSGVSDAALNWLKKNSRTADEKALVLMYETEFSGEDSANEFNSIYATRSSMSPLGTSALLVTAENLNRTTESNVLAQSLISEMKELNETGYFDGQSLFSGENAIDPSNLALYGLARAGKLEESKDLSLWIMNNHLELSSHQQLFPIKPWIEKGFIELGENNSSPSSWDVKLNGQSILSPSGSGVHSVVLTDIGSGRNEITISSNGGEMLLTNVVYKERSLNRPMYNSPKGNFTILDGEIIFKNASSYTLNSNQEFIHIVRGRTAGTYSLGTVNSYSSNNPNIWDISEGQTVTVTK